jgi:hypothetical protein
MKGLRVEVGDRVRASRTRPCVRVCVADRALRRRLVEGISRELGAAVDAASGTTLPRMVAVGSAADARKLRVRLCGDLAVIDLARIGAGRLRGLLAAVEQACPAGIQLVWTSKAPLAGPAEAAVFAILEERRVDRDKAPVILARTARPARVWRQVLAARLAAQEAIR